MHILTFDTLKARDKLVEAGMPEQQAAVHVSILAEVACLDIDEIATKDYIEARFIKLEAQLRSTGCIVGELPPREEGS